MAAAGGGFSHSAVVNLQTGRCEARLSSQKGKFGDPYETREFSIVIPGRELQILRSTAAEILAAGDTEYREQFAQQGVSFTARTAARTATADFAIDVGVGTTFDGAWDIVFNQVRAEADG